MSDDYGYLDEGAPLPVPHVSGCKECARLRTRLAKMEAENGRLLGLLRPFAEVAEYAAAHGIPLAEAWENARAALAPPEED